MTKAQISPFLIAVLLLVGFYFPSSIAADILLPLAVANAAVVLLLFLVIIGKNGILHEAALANSLLMLALLFVFTVLSQLSELKMGALMYYGALAVFFTLNLRSITATKWVERAFLTVNILNVALSVGVLAGSKPIGNFIVDFYSTFYPELVPDMILSWRKPVLTFGTHSIAGFFFFLFFFLNWRAYQAKRRTLYLAFAIAHVALPFALISVTGFAFGLLETTILLYGFLKRRPLIFGVALVLIVGGASAGFFKNMSALTEGSKSAWELAGQVFTSPTNGILGRFSASGNLVTNIHYLFNHPLQPIGFSDMSELMSGDCGPLDYLLRGSIFLLVSVYAGLVLFLRKNLVAERDAYVLLAVILAFEVGYTSLISLRFLSFLPFVIVYLNGLRRSVASPTEIPDGMALTA
jgi:hypothetical protein